MAGLWGWVPKIKHKTDLLSLCFANISYPRGKKKGLLVYPTQLSVTSILLCLFITQFGKKTLKNSKRTSENTV